MKVCSMSYKVTEDVNIMLTRQSNKDILYSKTWGKRGIHYLFSMFAQDILVGTALKRVTHGNISIQK